MITMSRADRAYCRKWAAAHRKGKPTAEITREWLAKLQGPQSPVVRHFAFERFGALETVTFADLSTMQLDVFTIPAKGDHKLFHEVAE